jgi:hypothetical protein
MERGLLVKLKFASRSFGDVALQATKALRMRGPYFFTRGGSCMAGKTILAHEKRMGKNGRGVFVQAFTRPQVLRNPSETILAEKGVRLDKNMALETAARITQAGCFCVGGWRSKTDSQHVHAFRGMTGHAR